MVMPTVSSMVPPQRLPIQSQNSSTLFQLAGGDFAVFAVVQVFSNWMSRSRFILTKRLGGFGADGGAGAKFQLVQVAAKAVQGHPLPRLGSAVGNKGRKQRLQTG